MRRSVVAIGAGLLIAVAAPVGWWAVHSGGRPVTPLGAGSAVALATAAPTSSGVTSSGVTSSGVPSSGVRSSAPASPPTAVLALPAIPTVAGAPSVTPDAPAPVRLQVPAIGVDAAVDVEGLDPDGAMALPERVDRVGWYRFGAAPGATAGAVVLAGHVDDAVQGDGAMFRLRDVGVGDRVAVTTADGVQRTYRVVAREEFSKHDIPLGAVFSQVGAPRLTLITCGGAFDRASRSYEDNIVVTATPV